MAGPLQRRNRRPLLAPLLVVSAILVSARAFVIPSSSPLLLPRATTTTAAAVARGAPVPSTSSTWRPVGAASAAASWDAPAAPVDRADDDSQAQGRRQRWWRRWRSSPSEPVRRLVSALGRRRGGATTAADAPQQQQGKLARARINWKAFSGEGATRIRKRDLWLGAFLSALATVAAVSVPLGYGGVVNVLLLPAETPLAIRRQHLARALQILGLIYGSEPLLTWFYIRHMTRLASNGVRNLKEQVFRKILEQEVAFYDRAGPGEITSYLSQDLSGLKDILYGNLQRDRGLRAILEALVGTVLLFQLQPKLGLLFSLVIPSVATVTAQLGRRLTKTVLKEGGALARENGCALEVVRNVREVKSFAAEGKETRRYIGRLDATRALSAEAGRNRGLMESCSRLAIYFSIFTVSTLGGFLVQAGKMSASSLVSFIGYCFSLNFAIQGINYSYADVKRGSALLGHVMGMLDTTSPAALASKQQKQYLAPEAIRGEVEFRDVQFSYPMRPDIQVLKGVNLKLSPGTVTSIVGPSGAGKTTLTQILSRFYPPTGGQLLLDGNDVFDLDPEILTREIALVGQTPNLFTGTIAYNIAYGAHTRKGHHHGAAGGGVRQGDGSEAIGTELMAEIREAARQANALDFIERFPDGFDTVIGEGGVALSGGQRQRIAIARAILKNSKVLILDEATSALDAESEALVQSALENLMKGRTTLVIAHRLGTVIRSDNIVVLKHGKVVEQGRHVDLMAPSAVGHYRQLMATQQTAYLND